MEAAVVQTIDTPIRTNDLSIDRVLNVGRPVVLIFENGQIPADLAQTMDRLAKTYANQLLIAQVPVRDNPVSVKRFGIQHPLSLVTIRDGKELSKAEMITQADLEQHAAYLLGQGPKPKSTGAAHQQASQAERAPSRPRVVTDMNFEKGVLQSELPVVVDFWAPWCGPCRMVAPVLEKIAQEQAGRLVIAKMNVDENPRVPQQFGVQSIPTMIVVKNGQMVDRWVGALPEAALRSRLSPWMK
jgi:thioredoxin 1